MNRLRAKVSEAGHLGYARRHRLLSRFPSGVNVSRNRRHSDGPGMGPACGSGRQSLASAFVYLVSFTLKIERPTVFKWVRSEWIVTV